VPTAFGGGSWIYYFLKLNQLPGQSSAICQGVAIEECHPETTSPDQSVLDSFTRELVHYGQALIEARKQFVPRLSPLARLSYRRISDDAEEFMMVYHPTVQGDFREELDRVRDRERQYRSTLVGPHRDDLKLLLNNQPAAQFGSEGQKRTLAISLKVAQAEYLTGLFGHPPVLLIDDVMGELDRDRRSGLMPLLERSHHASGQVFMTCTEENWPKGIGETIGSLESG
jgi:DNA replication and repair protein RecF